MSKAPELLSNLDSRLFDPFAMCGTDFRRLMSSVLLIIDSRYLLNRCR